MANSPDSLKNLANLNEVGIRSLGKDLDPIVVLHEYRRQTGYNAYGIIASVLTHAGLPSLGTTTWGARIAIEVVHPYIFEDNPTQSDYLQKNKSAILIAGSLKHFIARAGGKPHMMTLIDDIHLPEALGGMSFIQETPFFGWTVYSNVTNGRAEGSVLEDPSSTATYDEVVVESGYRPLGRELIGILTQTPGVVIRGNTRKRIKGKHGTQDVYLWEKDQSGNDSQDPSCEVLDLAYRIHNSYLFDATIILLPPTYSTQQRRVLQLQELLPPEYRQKLNNVTTLVTPR